MNLFLPSDNPGFILIALILTIWTVFWKGIALWRAARLEQIKWFIALVIIFPVNLFALPELIYLFYFSKKKLTIQEIKSWKKVLRKK